MGDFRVVHFPAKRSHQFGVMGPTPGQGSWFGYVWASFSTEARATDYVVLRAAGYSHERAWTTAMVAQQAMTEQAKGPAVPASARV